MNILVDTNIYLLKDVIDNAVKNNNRILLNCTKWKNNKKWQNNHELLIRNYEQMKLSRQRIIKQRDKLQQQVNYYKKREKDAQPILDCKNEVKSLLQSLEHQNGEISKLKQENQKLRNILEEDSKIISESTELMNEFTKFMERRMKNNGRGSKNTPKKPTRFMHQ